MYRCIAVVVSALLLSGQSDADQPTIKGYVFGDYYYVASGADKKQNGFQFRRIYLTFDKKLRYKFTGRFRLEASDAGLGSGKKMTPVVKDAYLKYQKDGRSLVVGLSPTPTWSFTESVWGYRSVEKTIIDLNQMGSSRDLGVLFETRLDSEGRASAQIMFGNGNGVKSEGDNDKKAYARIHFKATENAGLTIYADYDSRPGDQDRVTLATLFYGSTKERAFGLEGVWQNRKNATRGSDVTTKGISAFGRAKSQDKVGFFGRVDYFDPSDQTSDDAVTRIFAGVDLMPDPDIHIMPNIVVETFQDPAVEAVVTPRITLYYKF